jgi:acyl-CoA synthetase (NDP forming)
VTELAPRLASVFRPRKMAVGVPVAKEGIVKACSSGIPRKSAHGLGFLNQRTAENVAHAYEECVARVRRMDRPLIAGSVGGGAWAVDAVIE